MNNKFWVVGTNPLKYFENYFQFINASESFSKIEMNENFLITSISKIDFKSKTTLRQNLIAWEAFGFIKKYDQNTYIKIVDSFVEKELLEISFFNLFIKSNDKIVNRYRETILYKLFYLLDSSIDIINLFHLQKTKGNITLNDIKKEIGKFEKELIKKELYRNIVRIYLKGVLDDK